MSYLNPEQAAVLSHLDGPLLVSAPAGTGKSRLMASPRMLTIYQPRRPRVSPLWQIIHHGWDAFLALNEKFHRKNPRPARSRRRRHRPILPPLWRILVLEYT